MAGFLSQRHIKQNTQESHLSSVPGVNVANIFHNLSNEQLIEIALQNNEGVLAANGALTVLTGKRTGRSPRDKYIVCDQTTQDTVDWGVINQAISPEALNQLWQEAEASLEQHDVYQSDLTVGHDPENQINVLVRCNFAWHTLFCQIMFLPGILKNQSDASWTLINPAHYQPVPEKFGLNGPAAIVLDFTQKRILICGTHYAGEMKKAMFTLMNYCLPERGVLPMHCSATLGEGKTTLFFGLSGTGKTTLSADPERFLIGDDEHGWSEKGIFNFEGGCYAKCIRLSNENEPLIWNALRQGALMENVVLDGATKVPNFDSDLLTENTRAAYPLSFIPNQNKDLVAPHPANIVFLTCDLFGVLPPLARLTEDQIRFYFLTGYTALIGSTEFGSEEAIKPTFSRCFGAPFFPRKAQEYADLLIHKVQQHQAKVYLVNTGWYGGSYGEGGQRFTIPFTRNIIHAVNAGNLDKVEWTSIPYFDLQVPRYLEGVDATLLKPENSWPDKDQYQTKALYLAKLLNKNYDGIIRGLVGFESMSG
jgi:phosphoenolpyruvate carboxykinase (ATP)